MKDDRKTKALLIKELEDLRAEMDKLQARHDALEIVEEKFRNALVEIAAHQEQVEARNELIRQAQREQEISHRKYMDLFQSAPVGYVILDPDGVIQEANETLAQWLGRDRMELIGSPLAERISETSREALDRHLTRTRETGRDSAEIEFAGQGRASFFAEIQSVFIRDELTDSLHIRSAVQDMTLRRLAQQELERYRDTLEALVRDQTAKMRATDEKLHWEIMDRQLAEQALAESREKYRVLFQTFPLGICITDEAGWIMEVNAASEKILGLSSFEQINRRFDSEEWHIIRPDGTPMPARELPSVLALKENRNVEGVEMGVLKGVAYVVWLNVTASPIPVKGYGVAVAFQDVTDRKLAEERIKIHQEQLRRLASELSVAGERERSRIAVDLHDGVAQALTLAKMKTVTLEKSRAFESVSARTLREIRDLIEQTLNDTRTLILDLRPPVLYEVGLGAALEEVLEEMAVKHGFEFRLKDDAAPKSLDEDIRSAAFRAARELLLNVVKHAQADTVVVWLQEDAETVRITIQDDGNGFDPAEIQPDAPKKSFGLFSVREQMRYLGGDLQISSNPGQGTTAVLDLPVRRP